MVSGNSSFVYVVDEGTVSTQAKPHIDATLRHVSYTYIVSAFKVYGHVVIVSSCLHGWLGELRLYD